MKKIVVAIAVYFSLLSFTGKEIRWVAIGDSITYLNDHPGETGNRVKKGYLTRVVEKLTDIKYTNQGHNGWTSADIAGQIEKLGIEKADVYSVFLGTNDWWQGRPVGSLEDYMNGSGNSTFYGSFRLILDKLRSLTKEARIILITPLQRADFVYLADMKNNAFGSYQEKNGQTLAQFADAIIKIGRYEKFETVDLYNKSGMDLKTLVKFKRLKDPKTGLYKNFSYPDFIGIPFNPATDEYPYPVEASGMTYDGLHPSDQGNAVIAAMLVKIMKRY